MAVKRAGGVEKRLVGLADLIVAAASRKKDPTIQIPVRSLSNVKYREQCAMRSATPWTRSAVDASCIGAPSTRQRIRSAPGSGISSAVTIQGPIGQKVSRLLPRIHWPSANWRSRAETSLRHAYPNT